MDAQELGWFLALARQPNVTAVAQEQHISQPTLSRAIARVEKDFGVPLFDRQHGRLTLNRFGLIVQEYAQRTIEDLEMAKIRIRELSDPERGEIRIAYVRGVTSEFLPELLINFQLIAPNSKFDLIATTPDLLEDTLNRGRADIVLTTAPLRCKGAEWRAIFHEELFVALPRNHPLSREKTISIVTLAEEKFVVPRPNSVWRMLIDAKFDKAGLSMDVLYETSSRETIHRFISAGLAVALVTKSRFANANTDDITYIPISDDPIYGEAGAVWLSDRALTPIANRFLDFLLSSIDAPRDVIPSPTIRGARRSEALQLSTYWLLDRSSLVTRVSALHNSSKATSRFFNQRTLQSIAHLN